MDDLISRQAVIYTICDELDKIDHVPQWVYDRLEKALKQLPSARPERIRGRWIEKPHVHGVAYCSLCDYELHTNDTNFCPNCGAMMKGENSESN